MWLIYFLFIILVCRRFFRPLQSAARGGGTSRFPFPATPLGVTTAEATC